MALGDVMVVCKKCGKKVPSSEFVLDPVYRLMVCRNCSKSRAAASDPKVVAEQKAKAEEAKSRPAGWDGDDESVEKLFRRKQNEMTPFRKIDEGHIKIVCQKCRFGFTYNTVKRYPNNCPNCGTPANIKLR
ncbi:hypothetical protein KY363_00520 [Candidatus Woesearchaeota archaeon]|nr:hypothetical protein [Candidatus Woesearchaeota archaeon]